MNRSSLARLRTEGESEITHSRPPNGKKYAINMSTIGIWNKRGLMDEEFLFWDNQTFNQQIGLA